MGILGLPALLTLVFVSRSLAQTLYLLPSFQGTLLHNNGEHLHLAPLTAATYTRTYALLTNPSTAITTHTDYATATCAPSSHAGHCTPLPATGPITSLLTSHNVTTLPYDWRLPSSTLLPTLAPAIAALPNGSILLAHGTACRLATSLNPTHLRLVCLSPLPPRLAEVALSTGGGLLTLGHAHRYHHPAHPSPAKDFGIMEHELGLVGRRRLLPATTGPWDQRDSFAAPQDARVRLCTAWGSVAEYANGGPLGLGDGVCVQGSDVGMACNGFKGTVVKADAAFFELDRLVEAALAEIAMPMLP